MAEAIPAWSYDRELAEIGDEIRPAIDEVLTSGRLVLGDKVAAFERAFTGWLGLPEGVAVANGTDAITLVLKALDVGPGDEVATVSFTALATISAIRATGARPVFVDVDADGLLDPTLLGAALTPRTKAIVVVHLYGQCADLAPILAVAGGIPVVEDCA